jgi:isoamylase
MSEEDWSTGFAKTVGIFLNGRGIPDRDDLGEQIVDDSFLLLINANHRLIAFTLPDATYGQRWEIVVDTTDPLLAGARRKQRDAVAGGKFRVQARAMLVLRCQY